MSAGSWIGAARLPIRTICRTLKKLPGHSAFVVAAVGLLLLVHLAPRQAAMAQSNFDRLDLHVAGSVPVLLGGTDGWQQNWAAQVTVRTPYFGGFLESGVHGQGWSPVEGVTGVRNQPLPWWVSAFAFVGAHAEGRISPRADLAGGLRLGNYFMVFDTDAVLGQRQESEFALAPVVRVQVRLWREWRLVAEGMWIRTFTYNRMDALHVSAGVSVPVGMPIWLRRILE